MSRASSCLYTEIGRLNPVIKRAGRRGAEGSVFIDVAGNGGAVHCCCKSNGRFTVSSLS